MVQTNQILSCTPDAKQAFVSIDLADKSCKCQLAGFEPPDRPRHAGEAVLDTDDLSTVAVQAQPRHVPQESIHARRVATTEQDCRSVRPELGHRE